MERMVEISLKARQEKCSVGDELTAAQAGRPG